MPLTQAALKSLVHDAFIDTPFPADGYDMYAAQTSDDYGSPSFTTQHLPGRKWYELTVAQMSDCYAAFSYLRPDGWQHFIPAAIMLEIDEVDTNIDAFYQLRVPAGDFSAKLKEHHATLNRQQVKAVITFLDFSHQRATQYQHDRHRKDYAAVGLKYTEGLEPIQHFRDLVGMLNYWQMRLVEIS
jgi:hypothetical protein